jgi:hypothetical protein
MKRIIYIICLLSSIFIISGCGNNKQTATKDTMQKSKYADEYFLKDFENGLYARWDFINNYEEFSLSAPDYYKKLSNIELKYLSKYKDKKFKDSTLHEYAIKYINNLKDSKQFEDNTYFVSYATPDAPDNEYNKLYNERVITIKNIVDKYDIKISKKYKADYNDVMSETNKAIKEIDKENKINAIAENTVFENKGNGKYEAVVENNSGYNFEYITFSINLLNPEDVVTETEQDYIENIDNGQKFILKFYNSNTDFSKTKVTVKNYELK